MKQEEQNQQTPLSDEELQSVSGGFDAKQAAITTGSTVGGILLGGAIGAYARGRILKGTVQNLQNQNMRLTTENNKLQTALKDAVNHIVDDAPTRLERRSSSLPH